MNPAPPVFDLYSHQMKADPFPTFAQMRRGCPVHRQPGLDGETLLWFVTNYANAEQILKDEKHFKRDPRNALPAEAWPAFTALDDLLNNHMLNKDGDAHRRLRALVSKAFTPRRIEALRPHIQKIADHLLDAQVARGQMDLVSDFAFPLPTIVILEMLGIPPEDRERFRDWSSALVTPAMDAASMEKQMRELEAFTDYLRALFQRRRELPRDDLLTALLQAEEDGERLSEQELFSSMVLLIVAGHETTVSFIGNALRALFAHPEQMARLVAEPHRMPAAVEELLRYDGPVERALVRFVAEEIEVGGQAMQVGDMVIVILSAANRDEAQFDDADQLELARDAHRHLAFGRGPHFCLGAPLARLESEIALNTLLQRLPALRPAAALDGLSWRTIPMFRSLDKFPVRWDLPAQRE